jgi:tetratricopeptide (TPR) repeat protein
MTPISVCIIAKDEEARIGRCLSSIVEYGFEIIVVDTGSKDRTHEIAASHGAKVFDFPWINDFAAARNFAAKQATHEWVLAIDCDEYVTKLDLPQILALMEEFPRYAGKLVIVNEMINRPLAMEDESTGNEAVVYRPRAMEDDDDSRETQGAVVYRPLAMEDESTGNGAVVYRPLAMENKSNSDDGNDGNENVANAMKRTYTTELVRFYPHRYYHFTGKIHEQITPLLAQQVTPLLAEQTTPSSARQETSLPELRVAFDVPIILYHDGYVGTAEQIAAKNKRNMDMLLEAVASEPDCAYNFFQIGQTLILGDDYEGACEWFQKGLSLDLDPSLEYVQTMVISYGQSLLKLERFEEALNFVAIYDAFCEQTDFVFLMGRIYLENERPVQALGEFLKAIMMPPGRQDGTNSYLAFLQIAMIYDRMDNMEIALIYYRKCGDYPPAQMRLRELGEIE